MGETKNSQQVRKKISTFGMQQMCAQFVYTTDQIDSKLIWAKSKSCVAGKNRRSDHIEHILTSKSQSASLETLSCD